MVGLIFGIILLIAGIITGVIFATHTSMQEEREALCDEEGVPLRDRFGEIRYTTKKVATKPFAKFTTLTIAVGVVLGLLFTFFGCVSSVNTGHTGVITVFGEVEDRTLDAGFTLKAPWETIVEMDNRVQKAEIELACFSSDIQEVTCKYTLNYQINKANAQELYKTVGKDYYGTAIAPTVAESVKAIMAKYTAEQLIGSRSELAEAIEALLASQLARYNIEVVSTAIEDIDFTDAFTNAVEAKQVAAQNKLQAQIEQEQKLMEAQKAAERAKVDADAAAEVARIQAQACE